MDLTEPDYKSLARRARSGDFEAAEELFRAMHDPLIHFLLLLGVPRDDLDEIAQETAIELHRNLHRYNLEAPFLPWLRGIARHMVKRYQRRTFREGQRASAVQEYISHRMEQAQHAAEPWWIDVERLRRCLRRLSEKAHAIVQLHYFEGMQCQQVGARLQMNAAAVRRSLYRSREALRDCLRDDVKASD